MKAILLEAVSDGGSIEFIKAIASLWPLALIALLALILVIVLGFFRPQLRGILDRFRKLSLKRGDTELLLSAHSNDGIQDDVKGQQAAPPETSPKGDAVAEVSAEGEPSNWRVKTLMAIFEGKFEEAAKALEKLQQETKQPEEQLANEAWFLFHSYQYGDEAALRRMKDLETRAETFPQIRGLIIRHLGFCYEFGGENALAIDKFVRSAKVCVTEAGRILSCAAAADLLQKGGKKDEAIKILADAIGDLTEPEALGDGWQAMAKIYKAENDPFNQAIALQRALAFSPTSTSILFATAYACAEAGLDTLAALHYDKLLNIKHDYSNAHNNMGVTFSTLGAKSLATAHYKQAMHQNETLASANYAQILIGAGDLGEAEKVLAEARKKETVHENISHAGVSLHKRREDDVEIRRKALDHGAHFRDFMIGFAEATAVQNYELADINGNWRASNEVADLEVDPNKRSILVAWRMHMQATSSTSRDKFRLQAAIEDGVARGSVEKWKADWLSFTKPEEGKWEEFGSGFAYFSEGGKRLCIFVKEKDSLNYGMCEIARIASDKVDE